MGVQSLTGGNATNRVGVATTEDEQQRRNDRDAAARRVISTAAMNREPGAWDGDPEALKAARRWRDIQYAACGLGGAAS